MSRLIILSVVVFPQPDGPTSTQISPSGTSSESSRTASWPFGYRLLIASRRIIASEVIRGRYPWAVVYHPPMGPLWVLAEDIGPKWLYWPWVQDHTDEIRDRLVEHIELTVLAVFFGLVIALPLALLSVRYRRLYGPVIAITGVLYTIPSLALFALLVPMFGLTRTTALVPLTAYTLLILVRNTVTGLDGVPPDVKDAALGMGYSRSRQILQVELPLALPAIVAGIRIATVTTIGLVTVTALIGQGGLGALMLDGFQRDFRTPLTVGIVLSLALAVIADLLLVLAQRIATPWARAGGRTPKSVAAYRPPQVR